jgi:CheY-like chemotaxis protein/anti-sigma regulatory factor (Ser/Thr protein kinase)
MQAISLLVGALGGRLEAPGERAILAKIQSSVTALNALFDAILDISKLDAQVIEPSTQVVALNDLLNEIDLYHRASAEAKGLRFRVVVTRAVTRTDRALMIRVLGNLVSNAIRYTNRGGVLIGVRTRSDRWSVEVVDTGSGIPADKLDQIFDEFVQLDNPTHDRSKGLGLGLSIVRRMATLMGHEIAVKSVPGRGSVFSVGLPRVLGPQLRVANLAPLRRTHDVEGAFVAVVDDEKDVLFAMETLLNDWGCRTVSASSGNALIAALDEHARQIDLLITDFRISPTETGVDVIRKVREAQLAEVPAMIVTGSHSAADVHAAEVSGFLVLHKPIMAEHLLAAMSDLMRRQPRGA